MSRLTCDKHLARVMVLENGTVIHRSNAEVCDSDILHINGQNLRVVDVQNRNSIQETK